MLFNSLAFFIFLPIVFTLYWLLNKNYKNQNFLLFIASYFFYGWWDWRFLSLILFSSVVDFSLGKLIGETTDEVKRKRYLYISLFLNLGILGFFKYFNFFITEFSRLLEFAGLNPNVSTLSIILPIGISFYTFQTLSYTIDVYKKRVAPTSDFIAFSAFVSFFPQLVAGPVERAQALLPQFLKSRKFEYDKAISGCQQILWGFFKKIVIADNCALFVNDIFGYHNYSEVSGILLIAGAILFMLQIYADFSGYSDIAIGTARLFGFNLMQNFNFPYFATSTTEFWRKWHISISSWFRDYLNQPLFFYFRDLGNRGVLLSLFLTFAIIGLWHGAGWTYIIFGLIHGIVLGIELFTRKSRKKWKKKFPKIPFSISAWFITMAIWTLSLVVFRAENISLASSYLLGMVNNLTLFDSNQLFGRGVFTSGAINSSKIFTLFFCTLFMFIVEWINKNELFGLSLKLKYTWANWVFYYFILLIIFFYGEFNLQEFIYFQF